MSRAKPRTQVAVAARPTAPPSSPKALAVPAAFSSALIAMGLTSTVQTSPILLWSVVGAGVTMLALVGALYFLRSAAEYRVEFAPRAQHYLQACAQGTVLAYWGWYWRPVYDAVPLLICQLLFAYAFDMVLSWWRRPTYTLGFGPFPVVFSTNLFLWFRPDYFYLQFLMLAVGFAAKELIRWERNGRRTHIFNPSSFPLAVFSLVLILTGSTSISWGVEIARTQFNPPNIYLLLFLVGLPGQFLFGVTTMTMSAVLTTYVLGLLYFAITGSYFFVDSYIPVAVFLGMHLLFTDPSTSPRTELGRILFGMIYGVSNMVLYEVLRNLGIPAFYDKLLPVPLMNLSVRAIDRFASMPIPAAFDPKRLGTTLAPRSRNLAYMTVWVAVFIAMSAMDGVGDEHPGHRIPFWQQACEKNARNACENLGLMLSTNCRDGSGWACNELGARRASGTIGGMSEAGSSFTQACSLGFLPGCRNAASVAAGGAPQRAAPQLADYPVILRKGKGAIAEATPIALYSEACRQGYLEGCDGAGGLLLTGRGVATDKGEALRLFTRACDGGFAASCSNLGLMYYTGDGVPLDKAHGLEYRQRACSLGLASACQPLEQTR
jgi:hypothetical protein